MKLIFREYLASLKERGELDVIMPDLLSELGFTVISRPAIGTKQYGVDVVAVGPDSDGNRAIHLISIKPGDLRRRDWDVGEQSLRTSLNQILDVYAEQHIPERYRALPVVVVLCLGGDLHEDVRADVEGYMTNNSEGHITFQLWNGDLLTGLMLSGILRENALPDSRRLDFRKAVALVDEPDVSFTHFCRFVTSIIKSCKKSRPARLTAIRQIYLGLWTLFVWARSANNIEAPYLSSERSILASWSLIKDHLTGNSKEARQINNTMLRLIDLHNLIADEYLTSYVLPRAETRHGLASAVPSRSSLDINLRLFDIVGRISTRGLWQLHLLNTFESKSKKDDAEVIKKNIQESAELLVQIIKNNRILFTPIKDSQAIDINSACLFLYKAGYGHVIPDWISRITAATIFAYNRHNKYPCIYNDYHDLVDHPKYSDQYRVESTAGSILVPTLAVWAAVTNDTKTLDGLSDFVTESYGHSTLQLWYPGPNTEEHLYLNSAAHGLASTDLSIERSCEAMLAPIKSECAVSTEFYSLSPLKFGLWPLLITASRHHRVPVPPHFWPFVNPPNDEPG